MRMDFRHIANFISCSSPDSVEDLSASSPISEDDVVFVKVSEKCTTAEKDPHPSIFSSCEYYVQFVQSVDVQCRVKGRW